MTVWDKHDGPVTMIGWRAYQRFWRDARGFTALEYTLITVIIGTVVLAGVDIIGNSLTGSFGSISSALAQHASGT